MITMRSWMSFALLPLILSIGIVPSLSHELFPDADAIKAKGNSLPETNSKKVCGDKLCSDANQDGPSPPQGQVIVPGSSDPDDQLSLLFIQTANSGTFVQQDGENILTLVGSSPQTIWFADRPQRATGMMHTDLFISLWAEGDDSFASDPPNAALEFVDEYGNYNVAIVELTSATYSPESEQVQYTIQILGEATEGLSHYSQRDLAELPSTFDSPTLFIDNWLKSLSKTAKNVIDDVEDKGEKKVDDVEHVADTMGKEFEDDFDDIGDAVDDAGDAVGDALD